MPIWNLDGGCVLQGTPPLYGPNTPANVNFGSSTELGNNAIHISGNHIAPGMYFMEVKQGNISVKEKIIKIK